MAHRLLLPLEPQLIVRDEDPPYASVVDALRRRFLDEFGRRHHPVITTSKVNFVVRWKDGPRADEVRRVLGDLIAMHTGRVDPKPKGVEPRGPQPPTGGKRGFVGVMYTPGISGRPRRRPRQR